MDSISRQRRDPLVERSKDGYYHLGDIDLRLRVGNSGDWKSYSTAFARTPIIALPASSGTLAAADLAPTLPCQYSTSDHAYVVSRRGKSCAPICSEE